MEYHCIAQCIKTCVRCWKCQFECWPNRDGFLEEHDCDVVIKAREVAEDKNEEEVKEEEKIEETRDEEVKEKEKKDETATNDETFNQDFSEQDKDKYADTPVEDSKKVEEEDTPVEDAKKVEEEDKPVEDFKKVEEEDTPAEDSKKVEEEDTPVEDAKKVEEEDKPVEDSKKVEEEDELDTKALEDSKIDEQKLIPEVYSCSKNHQMIELHEKYRLPSGAWVSCEVCKTNDLDKEGRFYCCFPCSQAYCISCSK